MAQRCSCDGLGSDSRVDRARCRRGQILDGFRPRLVGETARHLAVAGKRPVPHLRVVGASAITQPQLLKTQDPPPDPEQTSGDDGVAATDSSAIVCPVCGGATVQEKCKVVCKSEICRGRVIMNCAEF